MGLGTKWKTAGPREQDWSCLEVIKTSGALLNVDLQEIQGWVGGVVGGGVNGGVGGQGVGAGVTTV